MSITIPYETIKYYRFYNILNMLTQTKAFNS